MLMFMYACVGGGELCQISLVVIKIATTVNIHPDF